MSTLTHKSIFERERQQERDRECACERDRIFNRTGWFSIAAHYISISVIIKSSSRNTQSDLKVLEPSGNKQERKKETSIYSQH